jgi:hypothetical protein
VTTRAALMQKYNVGRLQTLAPVKFSIWVVTQIYTMMLLIPLIKKIVPAPKPRTEG